jgi:hypothetical protein
MLAQSKRELPASLSPPNGEDRDCMALSLQVKRNPNLV